MFASLHANDDSRREQLLELSQRFSPQVEQSGSSVCFCITPLRKMMGSPHQIASEICRAGYEFKLAASLAIAANPDAAILLARQFIGVTLVTPGEERFKLAPVLLAALFEYDRIKLAPAMLQILLRWGVKTCEDLVALPVKGIAERLGTAGVYLRNLAAGTVHRPLHLTAELTSYEIQMELEHSLQLLDPLLFLLGRATGELCHRLQSQSRAARELHLKFDLEAPVTDDVKPEDQRQEPYLCNLEFPVPLADPQTILKLLKLHLERHSPDAPVRAFNLRLVPVEPRRVQGGIFLPPTPPSDKLQITLARIASMVGAENVGSPVLTNTHRPDAYTNRLMPEQPRTDATTSSNEQPPEMLRLAMRLFRPPLVARVQLVKLAPKNVMASSVKGHVLRYAGPWKTAGEWWADTAWSREEWDVALDDGGLYRIYQESASRQWFVHGIYD